MSSGQFLNAFYISDADTVHRIRIQPETAALVLGSTNTIPSGTGVQAPRAKVTGGKRQYGITARTVTISFDSAPPEGYKANSNITIPWLNPDTFPIVEETPTGTYLGVACRYVGRSPERRR